MTGQPRPAPLLLHAFSTFDVGGAQVRFATLANRHGDKFRHLVYAMDGNYGAADLLDSAVDFTVHEASYEKGRMVRNLRSLWQSLTEVRPDMLITYNWGAIEWAAANLFRGYPHLHIVDGFGPEEADRQLPRRVLFRRLALARNTTIIVPSRTLQEIATKIWRQSPAKVAYIPNGIDCARFELPRDDALAEKFNIPCDATVIGTVAALRREKNLGRLLDAFNAVPNGGNLRLVIVGDGPEREPMQTRAAQLGLADRVIFTGYLPDPAPILSLIDIFAISSDTEQMPISVLEAMATRLPVAGVDVGDVRHIVSDANKDFIVERDADRLGAVLSTLAADPALCQRIGNANRQHVEAVFDETTMVDTYARHFSGERTRQ